MITVETTDRSLRVVSIVFSNLERTRSLLRLETEPQNHGSHTWSSLLPRHHPVEMRRRLRIALSVPEDQRAALVGRPPVLPMLEGKEKRGLLVFPVRRV